MTSFDTFGADGVEVIGLDRRRRVPLSPELGDALHGGNGFGMN